ncbi:MAG: MBL fold metallo-hydrolase [Anaerolineales bacterium]|nr:MBL fold metallo-hydrolase [Anaerolineales bacterium]
MNVVISNSTWFEIFRVSPGVFAIREPKHKEQVISYLVTGDDKAVLIDTGMGIGNIRAEVERLTDRPVVVVNTHAHFDHIGDNYRFDEVWIFDDDFEVARIERGYPSDECASFMTPDAYRDLPAGVNPAGYHIRPSLVTRRLRHLEEIDLGGRSLSVHHTPGHSPGSICLLDDRDGLLFTGDTYYPATLYVHLEGSDPEAYRVSMAYLVGLSDRVSQLCPSHNEFFAPKEDLDRVLDFLMRIESGQLFYEKQDGSCLYRFEGLSALLPVVPIQQMRGIL